MASVSACSLALFGLSFYLTYDRLGLPTDGPPAR